MKKIAPEWETNADGNISTENEKLRQMAKHMQNYIFFIQRQSYIKNTKFRIPAGLLPSNVDGKNSAGMQT